MTPERKIKSNGIFKHSTSSIVFDFNRKWWSTEWSSYVQQSCVLCEESRGYLGSQLTDLLWLVFIISNEIHFWNRCGLLRFSGLLNVWSPTTLGFYIILFHILGGCCYSINHGVSITKNLVLQINFPPKKKEKKRSVDLPYVPRFL